MSLAGGPEKVGGDFGCYGNNLVDFVGLENTSVKGDIHPVWHPGLVELLAGKSDNTIVSLSGLREEYFDKVQGLDVEAIKAMDQDGAFNIMV